MGLSVPSARLKRSCGTLTAMFTVGARRGRALRNLRLKYDVKQQTIADRLGIGVDYLSRHETEHGGFGLPRGFGRAYQEALQCVLHERGIE